MWWETIDFEKVANAILILIVGLGGFFGINQARKKKEDPKVETVELAGAVINSKDVKTLTESFDRAAAAMTAMTASIAAFQLELAEHRRALNKNTDSLDDVHEIIAHMNSELRNLANAVLITSRK